MRTKLTVTIDRDLLPRAKRYARIRGVSLSSLIEFSLRHLADSDQPSFTSRWRGRLKPAGRSARRYQALAAKYL